MSSDAPATPYVLERAAGRFGADISPDGRFVAFTQGATQLDSQVFVQTFLYPGGGRWTVSGIGGVFPRWRADGRELFFVNGQRVNAVTVSGGAQVEFGAPTPLFELPVRPSGGALSPFDVSANGKRFVVVNAESAAALSRVVVALDWMK